MEKETLPLKMKLTLESSGDQWSCVNLTQVIQRQLDIGLNSGHHDILTPASTDSTSLFSFDDNHFLQYQETETQQEQSVVPLTNGYGNHGLPSEEDTPTLPTMPIVNGTARATEDVAEMDFEDEMEVVPILVRTIVPEFLQSLQDGMILAGKNLTWNEFVGLFTEKNPVEYVIRGLNGEILRFEAKVGDYADSFSEPPSTYIIHVEQEQQILKAKRRRSVNGLLNDSNGKVKRIRKRRSPKRKYNRVNPGPGVDVLPLEQAIFENNISIESNKGTPKKPRVIRRRGSRQSSGEQISEEDQQQKLHVGKSATNIKPHLLKFISTKVSNRSMLRIREELMNLKANEDYFKLTSISPLAAGLLEQMLCRDLPSASSQNKPLG